ncbi:hypothetical protein DFJ43DRAFT_1224528 [Lentinula guzmanii]|uniref:Uncharacterized protein n=1 Tax=Lentinula guzmanii TaxID=2804957 RepID=A0AA38N0W0_9AGAR|nr:hypothetical protein DFJ43DRAFT_1224528 [Lentinula guzmanii]
MNLTSVYNTLLRDKGTNEDGFITALGGDPTKMVLWVQSSGSVSVDVHEFAHLITLLSAVSSVNLTQFLHHSSLKTVVPPSSRSISIVPPQPFQPFQIASFACEAYLESYYDAGFMLSPTFEVIVDDVVFFSNYTDRYLAGHVSDWPAIFGTASSIGMGSLPLIIVSKSQWELG